MATKKSQVGYRLRLPHVSLLLHLLPRQGRPPAPQGAPKYEVAEEVSADGVGPGSSLPPEQSPLRECQSQQPPAAVGLREQTLLPQLDRPLVTQDPQVGDHPQPGRPTQSPRVEGRGFVGFVPAPE